MLASVMRRVASSLEQDGLSLTARKTVSVVRDRCFDLYHGTDTGGRLEPRWLNLSGPNALNTMGYMPTRHYELKALLGTLGLPRSGAFVDFGSGKGRVILLAAELGFRRVVGVELSPTLSEVARTNVMAYLGPSASQVEVINDDAVRYSFLDDESVFFFYNPFGEAVMRVVLENILASLRRRSRRIWLIYHNPECRVLFEETDVFEKVGEHQMTNGTVLIYTNSA